MALWGYNELDALIAAHPNIKNGILIDTNILVAATYDLDKYNEPAMDLIDSLLEQAIPIFCNVNIRAEFLDIHRRILYSEAIIGFERSCDKSALPADLSSELTSYRRRYDARERNKPDDPPLKLSDSEIKLFRTKMLKVQGSSNDLWTELCVEQISSKLEEVWNNTESKLGLNFLSLNKESQEKYLNQKPEWDDVVKLMSNPGLSSSDAMIVNMFLNSKFEFIASSDTDIAQFIKINSSLKKHCVIPDEIKNLL